LAAGAIEQKRNDVLMEQLSPEEAGANRAGETITGTAEDTATIGAAVMTAAIRMKVIGAIRAGVIITEGEGGLRTITPGALSASLTICPAASRHRGQWSKYLAAIK